ncbi:MAG: AEC family transporter [Planctomycetota bacterium]|jgi:predicted permease|nr:AEC family transporter [Planctomycetota bacterium]
MSELLHILFDVVVPVVVMIGLGVLVDWRLRLDVRTLAQLNFAVFVPALVAVKILESELSVAQLGAVAGVAVVHISVLAMIAAVVARGKDRAVLICAAMFCNSGNIGLPVAELAWPGTGASIMAVILMVQNFASFSFGVALLQRGEAGSPSGFGPRLLGLAKVPVIWAILLALLWRATGWDMPKQVGVPLGYLGDGLIPVALLTLGVQLRHSLAGRFQWPRLGLGLALRLLVGPLVAYTILSLWPQAPDVSAVILIAGGLPVAVNVYILAAQYDNEADLAAQLVFTSTVASVVVLPVVIAIARAQWG